MGIAHSVALISDFPEQVSRTSILPNAIDLHSGMAPADKCVGRGLVSKD
jgi:hypothetical protein